MSGENLNLEDGVNRKEAGFIVIVVAFTIVLLFAMYKGIVSGDFPNNVTDFLSMLACIIGLCEAAPKIISCIRGGGRW